MKLYEFEGHRLFSKVGIISPFFVVCQNLEEVKSARKRLKFPMFAKVQVLSGKRGKSGAVKICANEKQLVSFANDWFGKEFEGELIRFISLAQKVNIEAENYISISYDTVKKCPLLMFSEKGGVDIGDSQNNQSDMTLRLEIDPAVGLSAKHLVKKGIPVDFAIRLWEAFYKYDCRLVEVNPLAKVNGDYEAIDAKVILDDAGLSRHKDLEVLPKGAISAIPSKRELMAKSIDESDYRGTAGSKFIELDGDIAILASGGGASLLVMDSLTAAGGEPANYTEYSGNPPREKVQKLTTITLSRKGLNGCLVSGAVANFTDIFETLSGFCDGLIEVSPRPNYPIVIRRGGPRQKEAYEMIARFAQKNGFDIHLFGPETPISVASSKVVEYAREFKTKLRSNVQK